MKPENPIPTRSSAYQHILQEISYPHELLDVFSSADSIYKKLNPFAYNDNIAELEEELKKELWRLINDNLTDRQKEVVRLYSLGKTQIEIAKELGVNQSSITKCLAGGSLVHFADNKVVVISDLWQMYQENEASVREMPILCLDEPTKSIIETSINMVMQNDVKSLISITTTSKKTIHATRDHKFFTLDGWVPLDRIIADELMLAVKIGNSIEFEGIVEHYEEMAGMTYDIEVKNEYHNYVANEIVVKNCIHGNTSYKIKDSKGNPTTYGGVELKLKKIAKEDPKVNEILQKIAELRDSDPF